MLPDDRDLAFLWDMLESGSSAVEFISNATVYKYLKSKLLRSGVERQLEIFGEAAKKVSTEFKHKHPEIPWRDIIDQRNAIIHEYGEIRSELIWRMAKIRLPQILEALKPLIPNNE